MKFIFGGQMALDQSQKVPSLRKNAGGDLHRGTEVKCPLGKTPQDPTGLSRIFAPFKTRLCHVVLPLPMVVKHPKHTNCSLRVDRGYDLYTMSPDFFVWPYIYIHNGIFRFGHGIFFGGFHVISLGCSPWWVRLGPTSTLGFQGYTHLGLPEMGVSQ